MAPPPNQPNPPAKLEYGRELAPVVPRKLWKWIGIPLLIVASLYIARWSLLAAMEPSIGKAAVGADAPINGLPGGATNVHYYIAGAFGPTTCYEFDISETGFLNWAKSNNWPITPIKKGIMVHRYDPITDSFPELTVLRGHQYFWIQGDSSRTVLYDLDSGRAYFSYHSR